MSAYSRLVVVARAVSFSKYEFSEYLRFPSLIHLIKLKEKLNGQKRKVKIRQAYVTTIKIFLILS